MTRALITGVTGCVGSNLARTLIKNGIEVVGLCQPGAPTLAIDDLKLTRVTGDICEAETLIQPMQAVDWVFHVAAIADDWRFPAEQIYKTNFYGTTVVLNTALRVGVKKFIYTSSAAALGLPRPEQPLLDETSSFNLQPKDWVYAHSKLLAEKALKSAVENGLDAVSVLPTAILGPADMSLITGQLILRACKNELFPFPQGGVNYIDVRDVAEAQFQAALNGKTGERYLLGGHNLSHLHSLGVISDVLGVPIRYLQVPEMILPILEVAIEAASKAGLKPPIDRQRVRMSHEYMYYDNSKAAQALGLTPRPFDTTIEDTYRWYCEHGYIEPTLKHFPIAWKSTYAPVR